MDSIDSIDPRESGPITIGEFPQEAYLDFEERKKIVSSSPGLLHESSIVAATAYRDQIGITYDQLSQENGDLHRNRLFSQSDMPEDFSSQSLFQANSIMSAFGPEENQLNDIEKIDQITQSETNTTILQQANTLKECLENMAELNNILTEVKNQIYRLAKG